MSYQTSLSKQILNESLGKVTYPPPFQPHPVGKDAITDWACLKKGTPSHYGVWEGETGALCRSPLPMPQRYSDMAIPSGQTKAQLHKLPSCSLFPHKDEVGNSRTILLRGNDLSALPPHLLNVSLETLQLPLKTLWKEPQHLSTRKFLFQCLLTHHRRTK